MKSILFRVAVGAACAAGLLALSAFVVRAELAASDALQGDLTCQACHSEFHEVWSGSAHSRATSGTFLEAWQAQGQPGECLTCHTTGYDASQNAWQADGIACAACHSPAPANHPEDPMPTDRSANLCGTCHTETMFEWQISKHRDVDLACSGCHDPHGTDLKPTSGPSLCASCHRDRAANFAHSAHSQQGLTCADCHLGPLDSPTGEGHAVRDHSFHVRLETCNACHAYQMHDPVQVHPDRPTPEPPAAMADESAPVEATTVSSEPMPVSPLGFGVVSMLVGMAGGTILAPWLERWYQRFRRDGEER
jgi:predicted CXXCH cytochrome family protein